MTGKLARPESDEEFIVWFEARNRAINPSFTIGDIARLNRLAGLPWEKNIFEERDPARVRRCRDLRGIFEAMVFRARLHLDGTLESEPTDG